MTSIAKDWESRSICRCHRQGDPHTQERIIKWRGKPNKIRCDNGPEYLSGALLAWASLQGINIDHIQPGKPQHLYRTLHPRRALCMARQHRI